MSLTKFKALQFPSFRNIISITGSVAGAAVLLLSLAKKYLPRELRHVLFSNIQKLFSSLSSQFTLFIHEFEGLSYNQLFKAAELYLRPHLSPDTKRFRVSMPNKENKISVVMDKNQEIVENFNGVRVQWTFVCKRIPPKYIQAPGSDRYDRTFKSELCYFRLCFNRKHKDVVFAEYLPYVMEKAKQVKQEQKTLKLYTLANDRVRGRRGETWQSVTFDHPATFDTLALDLEVKQMIMEDLDRFVQRKDLYRKVGKAWKRGYLLYGPPGTGKSSLVAAMANYLNFDIYDLELTDLRRNSELRKLLISTGNRSIVVVEDIDCSIELQDRHAKAARPKPRASTPHSHPFESELPKVTLSGFLNFIDGLWSSCGDERIIVFTTNHKEKLDPALLRPGRMDVHIHMSYCSPCAFKMLASNYLGITEHPLFAQVEDLLKTTKVTPAQVSEPLLQNEDSEIALTTLIQFLTVNKAGNELAHTHMNPSIFGGIGSCIHDE